MISTRQVRAIALACMLIGCGSPSASRSPAATVSERPAARSIKRPPADRAHCVTTDVIAIVERVDFESGSSRISEASGPLIQAIAAALLANPDVEKVGVVGGRDDNEPAGIAAARAAAVTSALIESGVPAERLETHGLERGPGDDAATGRKRSVWFRIFSLGGQALVPADETRWLPLTRDCDASWRAWRERGMPIDCDCLDVARSRRW